MIILSAAYEWGEKCARCLRRTFTHKADNGGSYCGPCSDLLRGARLARFKEPGE